MSFNPLSLAAQMRRDMQTAYENEFTLFCQARGYDSCHIDCREAFLATVWADKEPFYRDLYTRHQDQLLLEMHMVLERSKLQQQRARAALGLGPLDMKVWFVTVRPKPGTTLDDLYEQTAKFASSTTWVKYQVVFEQKGECPETLGEGVHMHGLFYAHKRSLFKAKQPVVSRALKDFPCADSAAIEVEPLTTTGDEQRVLGYILDWKSEDGHKEKTREADQLWRRNMGLAPSYDRLPVPRVPLASMNPN